MATPCIFCYSFHRGFSKQNPIPFFSLSVVSLLVFFSRLDVGIEYEMNWVAVLLAAD